MLDKIQFNLFPNYYKPDHIYPSFLTIINYYYCHYLVILTVIFGHHFKSIHTPLRVYFCLLMVSSTLSPNIAIVVCYVVHICVGEKRRVSTPCEFLSLFIQLSGLCHSHSLCCPGNTVLLEEEILPI
jgi:hypothetical protein